MRGEPGGTGAMGGGPSTASGPNEPTWYGVIAGGAMFVLGLMGCGVTGLAAAMGTEADAVTVSYVGVPVAIGGMVALLAAAFTRTQPIAVATGVPIGCGCVTMVAGVVAMVVFFTVVWPSL